MIKADGYSTDEDGRYINRATQQSPEEDARIQRIGDLITFGVVVALVAIAAKLCWG